MPALSSSLAENRLHPSAQTHQTVTTVAVSTEGYSDNGTCGKRRSEVLGSGPGGIEPIGAFEVSKGKRLLQVGLAVVYCLFAAGVVFGYAALKPVMIEEEIYRDKCTEKEIEKGLRVCYEQEIRLNFMFTLAAVATNVCALLVGTILDQYGPRVSGIIGSILFALGCLGFSFAKQIRSFDPYPISYLLLALGGPFIFISSFHLSNAFPSHSGLILSMLTGAFDSSSAVFLLYRLLYDHTHGKLTLRTWFTAYLIVPATILILQLTLMPSRSYKTVGELVRQAEVEEELLHEDDDNEDYIEVDDDDLRLRRERRSSLIHEIDSLLGGKDAKTIHDRKLEESHESSGVWGAMHGMPINRQIRSWWFVLITLFTVIQMTRINYFVATIRQQYEFLLGSYHSAVEINQFFDLALPIGGILAVPLIGYLLDRYSTLIVLQILVALAAIIGGLGIVKDSYPAAIAGIIGFVAYRPFYYTAVSDYAAKVFGFETFGKVYGLIICLAGLLNLSQTGLDALTLRAFRKDPRPVNLGLLTASVVVGCALVGYVWRSGKNIKRFRLGLEAEGAREEIMPGGSLNGYGGV
ncbi:major facilitator superfamily domain-containing protein [Tuber borchii]|uniref:Major facilitator superfamily domain-containing protein n=1 Tax=Tuber borchii TaxID=42251 RepID=A0A2T6ZH35_TUBBO|nr:major facilitator superfamily domain-containing protein [Tuber borchii]